MVTPARAPSAPRIGLAGHGGGAAAAQKRLFCFDCGAREPRSASFSLCQFCYAARSRSRRRFAGHREAVLERDSHRCRVCGGGKERVAVHHRHPGLHNRDLLITVCLRCHARLHRLAVLGRWVPRLLAELWKEVHPGAPVQLQFSFEAIS